MKLKILITIMFLLFLLQEEAFSGVMVLNFDAKATGGDGNSISTYSYLKEPRIQESSYTRGLKSGSFNYFENGEEIDFREILALDYGNGTKISNSTLSHYLNLSFKGDLGISEIYGSGLFPNNRGLSAWKKIRYEKSNYLKTKDGNKIRDFKADQIWVEANVDMYTHDDGSEYSFTYGAGAKDAVIATHDSAGWSNRTGSRRIDLEHETLMTGNFELNNVFQERMAPASDLFGDWLPCCYNSTIPSLRQPNNPWPSNVVINTLREYPFEPKIETCSNKTNITIFKEECGDWLQNNTTKQWEKTCKLNSSTIEQQTCKTCKGGDCPGFECIKTFNEEIDEEVPESVIGEKLIGIQAIYSYDRPESAPDIVVYEVSVINIGKSPLSNLTLEGKLPNDAASNKSFTVDSTWKITDITPEWDSTLRSFTYKLDSMNRDQKRTIYLATSMKKEINPDDAEFSAIGYSSDGSVVVKDEASRVPDDGYTIPTAYRLALSNVDQKNEVDPFKPAIQDVHIPINGTHILYIAAIENDDPLNLPIEDVILKVELPNNTTPLLSYEFEEEMEAPQAIKQIKSGESLLEFSLGSIYSKKTKEIHILIKNDTKVKTDTDFDRYAVNITVEGKSRDKDFIVTSSEEGKDQYVVKNEEKIDLMKKAETKIKPGPTTPS